MADRIILRGLQAACRVGVPDLERVVPQRLEFDLVLEGDFRGLADDVAGTTDYAVVADWLRRRCLAAEFRLLESLAEDVAQGVLAAFPRVRALDLEVRKFVLPSVECVAVALRRERD